MTTYREAIYMCLDLIKGVSDDFTYTEDHIAYLLDKYRAFLLKQRYGNDPKKHIPYSNYQTLTVTFSDLSVDVNATYVSDNKIPYMLQIGIPRVTFDKYYDTNFEFTSRERLPFVGCNKFLKRIWYGAIDEQNNLCLKPSSTRYVVDDGNPLKVYITGVFENPREVIDEVSFGEDQNNLHELDRNIPIEEGLITTLIDLVVKEILGASYRPADTNNNNMDDNSNMASYIASNMKPQFQKQLGI